MSQDLDSGVAYLLALKNSPGPNAATGAAQARATEPAVQPSVDTSAANSGEQFKGAEKRRAQRYKCEGSAELRNEGCDVRTWATFTDISVHGCYVEAQATYPAGAVLEMKLDANGIRVETKGNVRVSYPYLGMGIAFVDMTEENQALLRQLLATITHPTMIMGPGIASSLPAASSLGAPVITNPEAVVQSILEFFESRQILMRDDFLRLLKQSQK
jgi:hypothetical protein